MEIDYTVQIWREGGQFIAHATRLVVASSGSTPQTARAALDESFLQAEDGIRDHRVTGVQTCALPICLVAVVVGLAVREARSDAAAGHPDRVARSEERRGGKEWRYAAAPYH